MTCHAAIAIATASTPYPMPSAVEKRAHIRWHGDAPYPVVLAHGRNRHRCGLKDISAGGAALSRDFDLWPGERVTIEISEAVRLTGHVVRLGVGSVAVRFHIAPALAAAIDQSIQLGLSPAEW